MKSFANDTKDELKTFINSDNFKKVEISKVFADDLIEKCIQYGLLAETEIVKFVTIQTRINHSKMI